MRNSYTRQLYSGPEFLDVLSRYLSINGLKKKYCDDSKYQYDHDNPIIRIADDASVSANKIVNIEEITLEMIR